MSLQDLAKELAGFNPKEDKINDGGGFNGLPAGTYDVIVEDASHKTFSSGWDCIGFTFSVIAGEHQGDKEMMNLSFAEASKAGKPIPDFVLERNARTVMTLGSLAGVDVPVATFLLGNETDIHEELGKLLHDRAGAMVKMTITERPNKKDPSNPYKEYEFGPSDQTNDEIDVSKDDLPF